LKSDINHEGGVPVNQEQSRGRNYNRFNYQGVGQNAHDNGDEVKEVVPGESLDAFLRHVADDQFGGLEAKIHSVENDHVNSVAVVEF
jgi:hypothetical protein